MFNSQIFIFSCLVTRAHTHVCVFISFHPLVLKHGLSENHQFIDDVPIQSSIEFGDFPAVSDSQMVALIHWGCSSTTVYEN
jgi:hypothetical protein